MGPAVYQLLDVCIWEGGFCGVGRVAQTTTVPSSLHFLLSSHEISPPPHTHTHTNPTIPFFLSALDSLPVHTTYSLPPPAVLPTVHRPELAACVLILLFCSSKLMNQWLQVLPVPSPCSS